MNLTTKKIILGNCMYSLKLFKDNINIEHGIKTQ